MKRDDRIYRNLDALRPVRLLLEEAAEGLRDRSRTIRTSGMPEVLGAALGAGVGGAVGFGVLYGAGITGLSAAGITSALATAGAIVGGGMAAGVFVLAAPAVGLGVGGFWLVSRRNRQILAEQEEMLYQEATRQRDAVIQEMSQTAETNKERLEYLTALNIKLQDVVKNLETDLRKRAG
ncbi:MAG TPA: hypothetical protein VFU02_13580 [Polyangiaceae bacterium]|nr:hypothetical protein [Polyangiaceae bacterium]